MRDYSARLPGFCVKPCSPAFSKGPPAMKCCAGCWGGPSSSRSPPPLSSGRGSIFRARMRRHHARARKAAGRRREPPRIVRKSRVRPKKIRTQLYYKNGHFLRGPSELYKVNAPLIYTIPVDGNTLFLLPEGVQNNCWNGFFLTGSLEKLTFLDEWLCGTKLHVSRANPWLATALTTCYTCHLFALPLHDSLRHRARGANQRHSSKREPTREACVTTDVVVSPVTMLANGHKAPMF